MKRLREATSAKMSHKLARMDHTEDSILDSWTDSSLNQRSECKDYTKEGLQHPDVKSSTSSQAPEHVLAYLRGLIPPAPKQDDLKPLALRQRFEMVVEGNSLGTHSSLSPSAASVASRTTFYTTRSVSTASVTSWTRFMTASSSPARSVTSRTTYVTASSGGRSRAGSSKLRLQSNNAYAQLLEPKKLWPVDPYLEQNWSGRGQHAEFQKHETQELARILCVQEDLGSTNSAIVQRVQCRRIMLARKTIRCNRSFTKQQAVEEVANLSKLDHSHVVRIIGTYVMGRQLSILMYPVADCNLQSFLDVINHVEGPEEDWHERIAACRNFFRCLSSALRHIHQHTMKHMDIKPSNILVRNVGPQLGLGGFEYKVYITDFGIAKAYADADAAETDGPTSFTRKYASPEVTSQDTRGLPADIFSLGCVFIEMLASLHDVHEFTEDDTSPFTLRVRKRTRAEFQEWIGANNSCKLQELLISNQNGGVQSSYQAHIDDVRDFSQRFIVRQNYVGEVEILDAETVEIILQMISKEANKRPTANVLTGVLGGFLCCLAAAEKLEAAPGN